MIIDWPPDQAMRLGLSLVWRSIIELLRGGQVHVEITTTEESSE